jgi:hypothetical protein
MGEVQVITSREKQDITPIDRHPCRLRAVEYTHASVRAATADFVQNRAGV